MGLVLSRLFSRQDSCLFRRVFWMLPRYGFQAALSWLDSVQVSPPQPCIDCPLQLRETREYLRPSNRIQMD